MIKLRFDRDLFKLFSCDLLETAGRGGESQEVGLALFINFILPSHVTKHTFW